MSRLVLVILWTHLFLWVIICPFTSCAKRKVASRKSLHVPDQNNLEIEPSQDLEAGSNVNSKTSMEWIRDYLIEFLETRSSFFKDSSKVSSTIDANEARQMPTQSSLGDAIAVAGLALLFINQISVALNLPFLLPFMLIPVALLTIAVKLLSQADNNNTDMVTQYLRAGWSS